MPTVTKPPTTRREPHAPRRDADAQALIKEARRRQRRRQALIGAGVLGVAAAVAIAAEGVTGGPRSQRAARGPAAGSRPTATTPFAVGAVRTPIVIRAGKVTYSRQKEWAGLVIVRPRAHSCTRVPLPGSLGGLVFSGRRYAYNVGEQVMAVGVIGRGRPRRFVARHDAWPEPSSISPVWVDGRLGLLESNAPRLRLSRRTITFPVPTGAQFGGILAASHGRIIYDVSYQNEWGTKVTKTRTFVYANGRAKLFRQYGPQPPGSEEDAWSPDGSRIAFLERSDLWTMRADGSEPRRLTSMPTSTNLGPLPWSPDGKTIAYAAVQHRTSNIYAVPANGGEPRQVTHSSVNGGGTRPLVWLGPRALAVASTNTPVVDESASSSLGVADLASGAARTICELPSLSFTGATALR